VFPPFRLPLPKDDSGSTIIAALRDAADLLDEMVSFHPIGQKSETETSEREPN